MLPTQTACLVFALKAYYAVKKGRGALVCRMSLNSDRCVGNMGVAVLLSQQHTISYMLRHAVTLLYDSSLLVFTSDPAIMKRKRRCDVDDVAV